MPTAGISASPEIVASKSLRQFFVTANSSRLAFPFSRCLKIPGPTTLGGRKARREMSKVAERKNHKVNVPAVGNTHEVENILGAAQEEAGFEKLDGSKNLVDRQHF
jgi:hypothetical protein